MFLVLFYLQNLPQRGDKFSSIHINVNYNLIKDIRLRQILILNYIATDKLKDYEIYAIVGENSTIEMEKTPPESVAMQHRCNKVQRRDRDRDKERYRYKYRVRSR